MTAKAIMVQGTMSGAGKSLLVAGLARVFHQDGHKVAPFKSQNMALNSSITADGLEMGRAQVMQAEAAGIAPEARMNPILLKPTDDTGSQVIVNGVARGNMSAREYFAYKHNLRSDIMDAYDDLAGRFDIIVIEGAGSPAEINLKDEDIVNMGMAKMASAPVLLAGDIDRGGVFAQLIGTTMLLEDDERAMVKGLIVNKFRGDKTILDPGLALLEEKTGISVVGVIPYTYLDIDDEDSLSDRLTVKSTISLIDIAVIRLPRISNFTDFMALDAMDGVGVRYVSRVNELGDPDLIIIPGTKNTIADLRWLRESGLEAALLQRNAAGTVVFGICGGYQMLGQEVSDPEGTEGGGTIRGMGLLPTRTRFVAQKHQVRSRGVIADVSGPLSRVSGTHVDGYEIHMGTTVLDGGEPLSLICAADALTDAEPKPDGCHVGLVYGSYLHGIFDSREFTQALVSALLAFKGLDESAITAVDLASYKEQQYDKLADAVRANMDMGKVYEILEAGI